MTVRTGVQYFRVVLDQRFNKDSHLNHGIDRGKWSFMRIEVGNDVLAEPLSCETSHGVRCIVWWPKIEVNSKTGFCGPRQPLCRKCGMKGGTTEYTNLVNINALIDSPLGSLTKGKTILVRKILNFRIPGDV